MRLLTVTTEGENRLGLRKLCQRYVNNQWFASHVSDCQVSTATFCRRDTWGFGGT